MDEGEAPHVEAGRFWRYLDAMRIFEPLLGSVTYYYSVFRRGLSRLLVHGLKMRIRIRLLCEMGVYPYAFRIYIEESVWLINAYGLDRLDGGLSKEW